MKIVDMKVDLIDSMGSDLTVVNAARVSFNKESEYEGTCLEEYIEPDSRCLTYKEVKTLKEADIKLIKYLAKHKHWTPFAHCTATLRIKCPIFVARQLHKHQVGLVVNEVSRRYVDSEPEFFIPKEFRLRAANKKQGSGEYCDPELNDVVEEAVITSTKYLFHIYNDLIKKGVAPEQARMILPLNTMTEFYMTGSLAAWARIYKLRVEDTAQQEIQDLAFMIEDYMYDLFPTSWMELTT